MPRYVIISVENLEIVQWVEEPIQVFSAVAHPVHLICLLEIVYTNIELYLDLRGAGEYISAHRVSNCISGPYNSQISYCNGTNFRHMDMI